MIVLRVDKGGFGDKDKWDPNRAIEWHIDKFLDYANDAFQCHVTEVVKESTHLPLIIKKIRWGYLLT